MVRLDFDRIRRARTEIDPVFLDSPQYDCAPLGDALGCSITLKIETLNPVRSFKGRGAETVLHRLALHEEAPTAICASAGNLGQALAYSGARRGIPVTVVAARTANPFKIERIRALGAAVRLRGDDIEDARLLARTIADDRGVHLVEDSLDIATCEGAGTIGLELLRARPPLDTLLIALGGGALASGVGHVAKSLAPHVEVIAVQPTGAPAMALSWRRGSVVHTDTLDTIADGVAGRAPDPGGARRPARRRRRRGARRRGQHQDGHAAAPPARRGGRRALGGARGGRRAGEPGSLRRPAGGHGHLWQQRHDR